MRSLSWNRTNNLAVNSGLLYLLSYEGMSRTDGIRTRTGRLERAGTWPISLRFLGLPPWTQPDAPGSAPSP